MGPASGGKNPEDLPLFPSLLLSCANKTEVKIE
jgi:hypothetical protein